MPTFDNTLQDEILDTTHLTTYVQHAVPTHLASNVAPDEQYFDDTLTHFTSYIDDITPTDITPTHLTSYVAPNEQYSDDALTRLTLQYADVIPTHLTSYVIPDEQYTNDALTCPVSHVAPYVENALMSYATPDEQPAIPTRLTSYVCWLFIYLYH